MLQDLAATFSIVGRSIPKFPLIIMYSCNVSTPISVSIYIYLYLYIYIYIFFYIFIYIYSFIFIFIFVYIHLNYIVVDTFLQS